MRLYGDGGFGVGGFRGLVLRRWGLFCGVRVGSFELSGRGVRGVAVAEGWVVDWGVYDGFACCRLRRGIWGGRVGRVRLLGCILQLWPVRGMLRGCGAVSRWVRRIPTGTEGDEAGGFAAVRIEGFIGETVRLERGWGIGGTGWGLGGGRSGREWGRGKGMWLGWGAVAARGNVRADWKCRRC